MILRRSSLAAFLFVSATALALFLGGALLNDLGFNYSIDSSAGGLKIHPYTVLTVLSLLTVCGGPQSLRRRLGNRQFVTGLACAGVTVAILFVKSHSGDAQSLGFAFDTMVSAFLAVAVVSSLRPHVERKVSAVALAFIVVESVMAVIEVTTRTNFIPVDIWYGSWFRSTALHGHPLNNALVLVTVATSVQSCAGRRISVLVALCTTAALLAFGARGALAAYLAVNAIALVRFAMRKPGWIPFILVGIALFAGLFMAAIFNGALGDRIAAVGAYDDSSAVRVQSVQLISQLDWPRIVTGISPDDAARIMDRNHIGVIENFLVGYILTFGALATCILLGCAYCTFRSFFAGLPAASRFRGWMIVVVFACTALTNNSLMTKTPALYLLVVGLWCFRVRVRQPEPQRAAHPMMSTNGLPVAGVAR